MGWISHDRPWFVTCQIIFFPLNSKESFRFLENFLDTGWRLCCSCIELQLLGPMMSSGPGRRQCPVSPLVFGDDFGGKVPKGSGRIFYHDWTIILNHQGQIPGKMKKIKSSCPKKTYPSKLLNLWLLGQSPVGGSWRAARSAEMQMQNWNIATRRVGCIFFSSVSRHSL